MNSFPLTILIRLRCRIVTDYKNKTASKSFYPFISDVVDSKVLLTLSLKSQKIKKIGRWNKEPSARLNFWWTATWTVRFLWVDNNDWNQNNGYLNYSFQPKSNPWFKSRLELMSRSVWALDFKFPQDERRWQTIFFTTIFLMRKWWQNYDSLYTQVVDNDERVTT